MRRKFRTRALSVLVSAAMVFSSMPTYAVPLDGIEDIDEIIACFHVHNEECYTDELICNLEEDRLLTTDSNSAHDHVNECYVLECQHTHDEACDGVEEDDLEETDQNKETTADSENATFQVNSPVTYGVLNERFIYSDLETGARIEYKEIGPQELQLWRVSGNPETFEVPTEYYVEAEDLVYAVTSISSGAFDGNDQLHELTIGHEYIENDGMMFEDCDCLETVTIVGKPERIGAEVFKNSTIKTIVVDDSELTAIGESAFENCDALVDVSFLDEVTSIGKRAFADCDGLTTLVLPGNNMIIGEEAFKECGYLEDLTIGSNTDAAKKIEREAFAGCGNLLFATISSEEIGEKAFWDCFWFLDCDCSLTDGCDCSYGSHEACECSVESSALELSDKVLEIGEYSFGRCFNLNSVTFGDSLKIIGKGAFAYLGAYASDSGVDTSINYSDASIYLEFPDSLTEIGEDAFTEAKRLVSVEFGSGLTNIGDYAFYRSGLGEAYESQMGREGSDESNNENGNRHIPLEFPKDLEVIGEYAFSECEYLKEIIFEGGTTDAELTIKKGAFERTSIGDYEDYITDGENAEWVEVVIPIEFPDSLVCIEDDAFRGCSISQIKFGSSQSESKLKSIGSHAFDRYSYEGPQSLSLSLEDETTFTNSNIADEYVVEFPDALTSIGDGAFRSSGISYIKFGNSLETIGSGAFSSSGIKNIINENGTETDKLSSFYYIYNETILADCVVPLSFPDTLIEIGEYAFSGTDIISISFNEGLEKIGKNAFWNANLMNAFIISEGDEEAVYEEPIPIILPNSLSEIGEDAFKISDEESIFVVEFATGSNAIKRDIGRDAFIEESYIIVPDLSTGAALWAGYEAYDPDYDYSENNPDWPEYYIYIQDDDNVEPKTTDSSETGPAEYIELFRLRKEGCHYILFPDNVRNTDDIPWDTSTEGGGDSEGGSGSGNQNVCAGYHNIGDYIWIEDVNTGLRAYFEITNVEEKTVRLCELSKTNYQSLALDSAPDSYDSIPSKIKDDDCSVCQWTVTEIGKLNEDSGSGGNIYKLFVPSTIIQMEEGAFSELYNLEEIKFADAPETAKGLTEISAGAFENLKNLESVYLPNTLKIIGDNAFYNCTSLIDIVIPEGVTTIGDRAFKNCTLLEYIEIPSTVTSIGESAFEGCTNADVFIVGAYPDELDNEAPASQLKIIGNRAFYGAKMYKYLDIPETVEEIGADAFNHCWDIEEVYIYGAQLEKIGVNAFTRAVKIFATSSAVQLLLVKNLDLKELPEIIWNNEESVEPGAVVKIAEGTDITSGSTAAPVTIGENAELYIESGVVTVSSNLVLEKDSIIHIEEGAELIIAEGVTISGPGAPSTARALKMARAGSSPSTQSEESSYATLIMNGTITGSGTISGNIKVQTKMENVKIEVAESATFTGNAIEPIPSVYVEVGSSEVPYALNEDFTCTYSNNIAVGTARVTVTPTEDGFLEGRAKRVTFTIGKAAAEKIDVTSSVEGADVTVNVAVTKAAPIAGGRHSVVVTAKNSEAGIELTRTVDLSSADEKTVSGSFTWKNVYNGTYAISAKYSGDNNHNPLVLEESVGKTFVVNEYEAPEGNPPIQDDSQTGTNPDIPGNEGSEDGAGGSGGGGTGGSGGGSAGGNGANSSTASSQKEEQPNRGTLTMDPVKGLTSSIYGVLTGNSKDMCSEWQLDQVSALIWGGDVNNYWKFQYKNGTYAKGTKVTEADGSVREDYLWEYINGKWWAFDSQGFAKLGWLYDYDYNAWFYIHIKHGMQTEWICVGDKWYYMNPQDDGRKGVMYEDSMTPDGYYVDASGAWDGREAVVTQTQ